MDCYRNMRDVKKAFLDFMAVALLRGGRGLQ
jgi:hypothetical protein